MTRSRPRIATAASASVVALALALAACGGGVKNSSATTGTTTGTTGTVAGGQSTTGTGLTTESGTTSTTTDATTGAGTTALAKETVPAPDSKDGTVDIAVLGLAVQGQLATLSVRFIPHFPSEPADKSISLYDMSGNALNQDQVSLVDPVGLKRYLVVKDSNNVALGSDEVFTQAVNNSSVIGH